MGSSFFKPSSPKISVGGTNLAARALGSGQFAAKAAAGGAQKDLGAALGLNKSKFKSQKTDGAYAKGPKI
jgi:hypothetical protein